MRACDCRIVVSNPARPHGLQPARLLCPWGFSRQEHWSRLPCPPPGDLPDPGIKPRSPALQADSLPRATREAPQVSLFGGKMRIAAGETAPQAALRNCSKAAGGRSAMYVISGKCMQSSTFFFFLQVSTSHEEQTSPCRILVLS